MSGAAALLLHGAAAMPGTMLSREDAGYGIIRTARQRRRSNVHCRARLQTQQQQAEQQQQTQQQLIKKKQQQEQFMPPEQPRQSTHTLHSRVANPATLATCLALFSLISMDIFAPWTLHALPMVDNAIHRAVVLNIDPQLRALSDWTVSDIFIMGGIGGWLRCSATALATRGPLRAAPPLGLAWLFYLVGFGAVVTDTPLVTALKQGFGRLRPSTLHHTFSYPSGHTTAAVFIVGALLVVLLPLANSPEQQPAESAREAVAWQLPDGAALAIWAAAWATTAAGRVLADVHWLSDTLAGGCLAVGGVSALAWLVRQLDTSNQQQ